jgi:hypothetical protein
MSSLALQKAIVAALKADPAVVAVVGDRIYDNPPTNPPFPYITIGPDDTLPDRANCYFGDDVTLQIDAWSRSPGFQEVKRAADAVRDALEDAPLTLDGFRLVDITLDAVRTLRDPDGLTSHAAITFKALTEPI